MNESSYHGENLDVHIVSRFLLVVQSESVLQVHCNPESCTCMLLMKPLTSDYGWCVQSIGDIIVQIRGGVGKECISFQ